MKKGFSIIICCYNSAKSLGATLRYASRLLLPPQGGLELLIVDNASTDDTIVTAERTWKELGAPYVMRIINQPEPGLSNARTRGILEAQYEYLLFCDDDNWLQEDYLTVAVNILSACPQAGMLGGCGEGVSDARMPAWMKEIRIYGCGAQAEKNGTADFLYGAGLILLKPAFERLLSSGYSFKLPDRRGIILSSGGDYELSYAVRLAGYTLLYDDRLRFKHYLPSIRFSKAYIERFIRESNDAQDVLNIYRYFVASPSGGAYGFARHFSRTVLHHMKRAISCCLDYTIMHRDEEKKFLLRFYALYHRCRMYRSFTSLASVRRNYKDISRLHRILTENTASGAGPVQGDDYPRH